MAWGSSTTAMVRPVRASGSRSARVTDDRMRAGRMT